MGVSVVGEPLAELTFGSDGTLRVGLGGDAANVAARLARGGADARLHSAIGGDALSRLVGRRLREERVELVGPSLDGERVGIYLVATDAAGDRSFTYWRDGSAASWYLAHETAEVVASFGRPDVLHVSGITLALLGSKGRSVLRDGVAAARANGTFVAFDPNHRAALWPDPAEATSAASEILPVVDVVLASLDDCSALFERRDAGSAARSLRGAGVSHVAVTDGASGCVVDDEDVVARIEAPVPSRVIDTTGAGDAFDAGWILAWIRGAGARERARAGLEAAAACVGHTGALD
jgi:2-dehydro-3-deoxygluconokinase